MGDQKKTTESLEQPVEETPAKGNAPLCWNYSYEGPTAKLTRSIAAYADTLQPEVKTLFAAVQALLLAELASTTSSVIRVTAAGHRNMSESDSLNIRFVIVR